MLIAGSDQLKEMMRLLGSQPCIADLINDENTRGAAIRLSKTVKTGEGQQRDNRPDDN